MFSNGHFNCTKRQNKEFNHQSKEGCQAQAEGQNQLVPLSALALPSQWVLQVLNIECGRRVSLNPWIIEQNLALLPLSTAIGSERICSPVLTNLEQVQ